VAQYNYFVDLAALELEMLKDGHFEDYIEKYKFNERAFEVIKTKIPYKLYYLPFTMCLISSKSYKTQFFKILEDLYYNYVKNAIVDNPQRDGLTLEQCINKIVFGIPTPPKKKFEYFSEILPKMHTVKDKSGEKNDDAEEDSQQNIENGSARRAWS